MSFYDILNITRDASPVEIKKAYHTLAKLYHPDKNKSPEAEEKFKQIKEAYETLSAPDQRIIYDLTGGSENNNAGGINVNMDDFQFFGFDIFNDIDIDVMFEDINDIIREKQKAFKTYPPEEKFVDAPPTHINCNATLEDIYKGTIKQVNIEQTSPCGKEQKTYHLALNRRKHVFPKQGNYTCVNERPGDLIFTVYLKKTPRFKRIHGVDLLYVHPITLKEFMEQEHSVLTLPDGKKIRLKPCGQQFHVIENKGFLKEDGIQRGRLYVYFQVQFREQDTDANSQSKPSCCITSLLKNEL